MLLKQKRFSFLMLQIQLLKTEDLLWNPKKQIYDIIPQKYYPKTELVKEGTSFEEVVIKD